jgi:hypothetical protein
MPRQSRLSRLRKHKYAASFRPASPGSSLFTGPLGIKQGSEASLAWSGTCQGGTGETKGWLGSDRFRNPAGKCCSEMWPAELVRPPVPVVQYMYACTAARAARLPRFKKTDLDIRCVGLINKMSETI